MRVFLKIISILIIAAAVAVPIAVNQWRRVSAWRNGLDGDGTYKKVGGKGTPL